MQTYQEFLKTKIKTPPQVGFEIEKTNHMLFDWQSEIVKWAVKKGKAAIFAGCGLGKTPMQLDWADIVCRKTGGNVLIVAPLAVSLQTIYEGEKFGVKVNPARADYQVEPGINITNYEMLDRFDATKFIGVVLDESSILKSYMGATKQNIINTFKNTPFKLACTATPAPNDYLELGNHSEFLDVMTSNEMIMRFFVNESMDFGKWRIKGHAIKHFWQWISSWAVCLEMPSDIGYSNDGFKLPPLNINEIVVNADIADYDNGKLFKSEKLSATEIHSEMRETAEQRALAVANLVNNSDDYWLVWCNTNYEADNVKKLIPGAQEIRGSDSIDRKESLLFGFSQGKYRVLITKPTIAGFGLNWQHCNKMAFVGLSYSFEQQYQAIRRCWRFGQEKPVDVFIVMAETEVGVYRAVQDKGRRHEKMVKEMQNNINSISQLGRLELTNDSHGINYTGKNWEIIYGDCVQVISKIPTDSIHFTIFSPPFSQLYIYSDSIMDMGNSSDDEEFFKHFEYLIPELYRVTMPGRLVAVHCKNLVNYKNRNGQSGLRDFRGDIIRSFIKSGWIYHSEICIWKDPVIEMQRTKSHGLLYKQLRKDSSYSRQGLPDYVCVFRKWSDDYIDPEPITKTKDTFQLFKWQNYASPVWFDIKQTKCLNIKAAKDEPDEKHICPLQLEVIERCVELWTNPGDTVFSPFAGIGSEGYEAVRLGRKFIGIELKEKYCEIAIKNLKEAEMLGKNRSLFND